MSRVALLFGEQALVVEYNERVAEKLAVEGISEGKSSTIGLSRGIQQLLDDIDTYDPYVSCRLGGFSQMGAVFEVKKDFYRLISLVLSDLGLIFNIRFPSPWEVISELQTQEIIDESELANMKVCLSIANEIRLKTYFANGGQKEVLSPVPGYTKPAKQCSNNSQTEQYMNDFFFYPDFDVVVRLLSTSIDMRKRCREFCIKYNKYNEIDIRIFQNPSPHFSKARLKEEFYCRFQNFPKALESMESISEDSADYPDFLFRRAYIYFHCEENEKSVELFEKALEAYFKNEEMSSFSVLNGMHGLADALLVSGECEKAKLKFEEAIDKHDEIYGQGSQTAKLYFLLCGLGSTYSNLHDSALALETYRKAEKMENSLTNIPVLRIIMKNFTKAKSLAATNQYLESVEYIEKALYLSHKLYGKDNLSINLAYCYLYAGFAYEHCLRIDEAVSWYERSSKLFHLIFDKKPCEGKIGCLIGLGMFYFKRLEADKAVESLQDALEVTRTLYHNKPHSLQAFILFGLGRVMKKNKNLNDSLQYFEEAKEIFDTFSGSYCVDSFTALTLEKMGKIYFKLGNLPTALQCFKNAFSLYSVVVKQDEDINKDMAVVCTRIASVSREMKNFMQAKDYFTKAAVIFRKIPLTKYICERVVDNLLGLLFVCEDIGETDEALKHLEEARDAAKAVEFKHFELLDMLHRLSKKYNI